MGNWDNVEAVRVESADGKGAPIGYGGDVAKVLFEGE